MMLIEITLFLTILWLTILAIILRPVRAIVRARNGK
jgi:hypothetical protein